eukprot:NODE_4336_length_477_cov_264.967290_g3724_i0.p1 GENE.NODE_4336_length_477_cov_264.967290_g3724_i0~~NODE_4336_length_477_cov_264.967290_g3724_i0.p1  ORF type:complete len:136 (-),score=42.29 NODE_4336_length_477_cov_264.967290_g3724_i0:70-417(-)
MSKPNMNGWGPLSPFGYAEDICGFTHWGKKSPSCKGVISDQAILILPPDAQVDYGFASCLEFANLNCDSVNMLVKDAKCKETACRQEGWTKKIGKFRLGSNIASAWDSPKKWYEK